VEHPAVGLDPGDPEQADSTILDFSAVATLVGVLAVGIG
jgi:hypothetical protein